MFVSTRTIRILRSAVLVIGLVSSLTAAPSGLSGRWRIDLARSTELSPWKDYVLDIKVDGDAVTIDRRLAWGSREFADQLTVRAGETVIAPAVMWPDNRHLGAYISDARTKQVRAEWRDDRRLLHLSTDLVLETQQGSRTVNILSDYKVSTAGTQLTLTERRSTRHRPIVYLFTRATEQ